MHFSKNLVLPLFIASIACGGIAYAQQSHEMEHPAGNGATSTEPSTMPSGGMMGGGMMGGGGMGGMMGGGGMGGMMHGGMQGGMGESCPMMGMTMGSDDGSSHAAGRIAFLKAELAITDAQQSAFNDYAAAWKKNLEAMQAMRATMMSKKMSGTAVERLDTRIDGMEKHLAILKEIKPALAKLYASLSDEQKKKADQILVGMGCMM